MRVLLADKSELIIQRLEELLSEIIFILGTDRAFSHGEALSLVKLNEPDVVVLDMHLTDNSSFQLVKEIKDYLPQTVVIVIFIDRDEYIIQQCKKSGADFFFDKYHEFDKIPAVVNAIAVQR